MRKKSSDKTIIIKAVGKNSVYKKADIAKQELLEFVLKTSRKSGTKKGSIELERNIISWTVEEPGGILYFSEKKKGLLQRLALRILTA